MGDHLRRAIYRSTLIGCLVWAASTIAAQQKFSLIDYFNSTHDAKNYTLIATKIFSNADLVCAIAATSSPAASFSRLIADSYTPLVSGEDSNSWYIGFRIPDEREIWIYPVSHDEVLWNDFSSSDPKRITSSSQEACGTELEFTYSKMFNQVVVGF